MGKKNSTPAPATINTAPDALLNDQQAAIILGVLPRTLRLWRHSRGLPYLRITSKVVRYRRGDIEGWLDRHRVQLRPL
jgi:hypothetical protein